MALTYPNSLTSLPSTQPTLSVSNPGHSHSVYVPTKRSGIYIEGQMAGKRQPRVDGLLNELFKKTRKVEAGGQPTGFHMLTGDQAIEVFGNYNPLYSGRPKKLTKLLLDAAAGRHRFMGTIAPTGLFYALPVLVGVRKMGMRTSAAGLILLDHWAEKFPRFKPFLDAYVTKAARKQIMCDCYDLSMGFEPGHFAKAAELNKMYQLKADSRELKRLKKEKEYTDARMKQDALYQQQMMSLYQNALYQQQTNPQLWQQQLYGNSTAANPAHGHGISLMSQSPLGVMAATGIVKTTGGA